MVLTKKGFQKRETVSQKKRTKKSLDKKLACTTGQTDYI